MPNEGSDSKRLSRAKRAADRESAPRLSAAESDEREFETVAPFMLAPAPVSERAGDDAEESKALRIFVDDVRPRLQEATGPTDLIDTTSAGHTDRGVTRRKNEDSVLIEHALDLYLVADGMGGIAGGDVASELAVNQIRDALKEGGAMSLPPRTDIPQRAQELVSAVERANKAIYELANSSKQYQGMGTTIVAARVSARKQLVYIAHVGDSRAYRFRAGNLELLTTDHTLAGRGVTGPLATNVRRALGMAPTVKVDLIVDQPRGDDLLLLCTDGLTKMVPESEIKALIIQHSESVTRIVKALIAAANARGGRDNISVVAVRFRELTVTAQVRPVGAARI